MNGDRPRVGVLRLAAAVFMVLALAGILASSAFADSAPQGNWVGTYGAQGYDIAAWQAASPAAPNVAPATDANDLSALPAGVSVTLVRGTRYVWAASTGDVRALESVDQGTRNATAWYDASKLQLQVSFTHAYSGNLHLYAVDWDSTTRRESIDVNGQAVDLSSDFSQGAWVSFPLNVAAGGTATITVTDEGGNNAVLSGIFLGDAGSPPTPAPSVVYDNVPSPLPGNSPSLGFEATSTSEFGGQVALAGSNRLARSATVVMSSWGCETGGGAACQTTPGATFSEPITLNLYAVGANNSVGSKLGLGHADLQHPVPPVGGGRAVQHAEPVV